MPYHVRGSSGRAGSRRLQQTAPGAQDRDDSRGSGQGYRSLRQAPFGLQASPSKGGAAGLDRAWRQARAPRAPPVLGVSVGGEITEGDGPGREGGLGGTR